MARDGQSTAAAEKSATMKTVAAAGIGSGTVLVLGLGAWTLLARRRAAATGAVPPGGSGQPPRGW